MASNPGEMTEVGWVQGGVGVWSGVPSGAKELALVVDDPKAGHYVHWTVVGIPPTVQCT